MPNVFDYLAWRGDLTFAQSPFNEADSLIHRRAASALRMMRACLPPLQPAAVFAMHGSRAM